MRFKAIAIGAATSAGVAAIAFGAPAVSTAFSADQQGNITATAGTVALGADGINNIQLDGLLPGTPIKSQAFTVDTHNVTGSADLSVTDIGWKINNNGSGGQPSAADITVTVNDETRGGVEIASANLGDLETGTANLVYKNVPKVSNEQLTVTFTLKSTAGNEWNGASVSVPFKLHLQSAS